MLTFFQLESLDIHCCTTVKETKQILNLVYLSKKYKLALCGIIGGVKVWVTVHTFVHLLPQMFEIDVCFCTYVKTYGKIFVHLHTRTSMFKSCFCFWDSTKQKSNLCLKSGDYTITNYIRFSPDNSMKQNMVDVEEKTHTQRRVF